MANLARSHKTLKVNSHRLSSARTLLHKDYDQQGLLTAETVRRFIESQMCPFCPAGPFRILSIHTSRSHSITALELKHLAGWTSVQSTASAEVSAERRARAIRNDFGSMYPPAGSEPRRRAAPKIGAASRKRLENDPGARQAFGAAMQSDAMKEARAAKRNLQGHGTRASYRRGCRCTACVEATNAPRRSGQPSGRPATFTPEHIDRALTLMRDGMTQREAARTVGMSEARLSQLRHSKS